MQRQGSSAYRQACGSGAVVQAQARASRARLQPALPPCSPPVTTVPVQNPSGSPRHIRQRNEQRQNIRCLAAMATPTTRPTSSRRSPRYSAACAVKRMRAVEESCVETTITNVTRVQHASARPRRMSQTSQNQAVVAATGDREAETRYHACVTEAAAADAERGRRRNEETPCPPHMNEQERRWQNQLR